MHGGKSYLTHSGSERDGGAISSERYEVHVPHDKKDQFVKDLHKRLSEEDEDGGYFSESRDDDIDGYHSIKAKGVHLET
jgi:hypothetical protein